MFGEVQVNWNITPAVVSEFEAISGTVTMRDRQSVATIILKVLRLQSSLKNLDVRISILPSTHMQTKMHHNNLCVFHENIVVMSIMNQALDDDLPEEHREYQLTLTSATSGLEISPLAKQAKIIMAASDNPYGMFSFTQHQIRVTEEEGMVRSTT